MDPHDERWDCGDDMRTEDDWLDIDEVVRFEQDNAYVANAYLATEDYEK